LTDFDQFFKDIGTTKVAQWGPGFLDHGVYSIKVSNYCEKNEICSSVTDSVVLEVLI